MLPPERMIGVLITGFEEQSYIAGETAMPDRNDARRYVDEIELDLWQVNRLANWQTLEHGSVSAITFIGRRTRQPRSVDHDGTPTYVYVVLRLETVRFLGRIIDPDPPSGGNFYPPRARPGPP
jgi:hypothetical protein